MRITGISVYNLTANGKDHYARHGGRLLGLEMIPGMGHDQYKQRWEVKERSIHQVMKVFTNEGIEGVCTVDTGVYGPMSKEDVVQLNHLVVGENPLHRERLYHKLHTGTRWIYAYPGWFGSFDNCLWDILGKVSGLPLYEIFGHVREKIAAYQNIGGETKEEAAEDAKRAVSEGFLGIKDHFYHPVSENIRWFETIRQAVGPEIDIMHDAVGIYSLPQAIRIGRVLEILDYRWFEEPLPERIHVNMKSLCQNLDIPILAPEMIMNDVDICAQWLISGATDMIRANARHGTTAVLKLAHLAELYGTTVELNGDGGLFGLVHSHLLCSISNTSYYEYFDGSNERFGLELGMTNPVQPVKGYVTPPDGPGWGSEWDEDYFKKITVSVIQSSE